MARRRKGVMPAGLRRYWAKHKRRAGRKAAPKRARRRARRNPFTASGVIANSRRRTRRARRNYTFMANRRRRRMGRRSARRNPALLGFNIPPLDAVLFTGAGLVVPPMVASLIMRQLPAEYASSRPVYYAVKAASVLVPSMLVKRFVSQRAGNLMLLGGAASFVIDILKETGVFAAIGLSGAASQPLLGYYPGLSRTGGLGKYPALNANGSAPLTQQRMISNVPERLNPTSRF